ncbi:MAG: ABC transporter ATP-binding protein [Planctomycetota bacterium]
MSWQEGTRYLRDKAAWIARAWRGSRRFLPVLLFMTLLSTTITLAYPLAFGAVLERLRALEPGDAGGVDEVRGWVWVLIAIALGRLVAGFYPAWRALVNSRIEWLVRERAFQRVLAKGYRFFTHFRTGDIVSRLTEDIAGYPKIAWFCCSGLFRALDSLSRVLFCLGVMVWLDARLALWSLLPVPLMVSVFFALNQRLRAAAVAQREAASETSSILEAFFSGVTVVQAHNAEARLGDQLAGHLEERAGDELRLARLWVMFSIFFQALNVVGQLVVVLVGGMRVLEGSLELGTFFAFYLYLGLLLAPMMDLPNLLVTARQAFVCMERLDELDAFDRAGEGGACRGAVEVSGVERLELRGGEHRHDPRRAAAADEVADGVTAEGFRLGPIDLELRRGERVALVGEVGAGKTTLLRVLSGVLPPARGEVLVDGVPLAELSGESYRRALGYVPQAPILFSASVRENVLLGREEDPALLARALRLAGLSDEIAALPGGLDHELGLRGAGLSGGQRQRLTIARALYGSPRLLLLDDLTAALDAENEERFWEAVLEEDPEVTVLAATHREATARRMDRALRLERGRLAQGAPPPAAPLPGEPVA